MNHNHYSFGLTALLMFICQSLSAHDFEVDGIYYTYLSQEDKTVSVTYRGDDRFAHTKNYSGNVVIPATVTYQGMTYSVTSIGEDAFYKCTGLDEHQDSEQLDEHRPICFQKLHRLVEH